MRSSPKVPRVHFFVCTNRRDPASPLGAGCAERGDRVYQTMKAEVARRSAYEAIWITQTACLGLCPKRGATIAVYPGQRIITEVDAAEVAELFRTTVDGAP